MRVGTEKRLCRGDEFGSAAKVFTFHSGGVYGLSQLSGEAIERERRARPPVGDGHGSIVIKRFDHPLFGKSGFGRGGGGEIGHSTLVPELTPLGRHVQRIVHERGSINLLEKLHGRLCVEATKQHFDRSALTRQHHAVVILSDTDIAIPIREEPMGLMTVGFLHNHALAASNLLEIRRFLSRSDRKTRR